MATTATNEAPANTTATESKAPKVKTVLDDMPSRTIRNTKEEAAAFLTDAAKTYADFGNYEIISPYDASRKDEEGNPDPTPGLGQNEDGSLAFDPIIFPDDMRVMISVLTQRGDGPNSSKVKAIVVAPVPTVEAILADTAGLAWIEKIVGTELNRVAVRQLRPEDAKIGDVTLLDSMPKTLADYVTSNRGAASTLLEAFEEYWKAIKAAFAKLSKSWKLANLSKKELKNAMSSKAYASQYYPTLEETPKGSLFVIALQAFEQEAKKGGKDATIFAQWLATRDEHVISDDEQDDDDDISLDALTAAMSAPAEPAAEAGNQEAAEGAEAEQSTEDEQAEATDEQPAA